FSYRAGDTTTPAPWMTAAGDDGISGTPATAVTMFSDPGEFIGGGLDREFDGTNASIGIAGDAHELAVNVSGGTAAGAFGLLFAAPPGDALAPGAVYLHAQTPVFRTAGHAGIDIAGDARGCEGQNMDGAFEVRDLAFDPGGAVSRLWIVYQQPCIDGNL